MNEVTRENCASQPGYDEEAGLAGRPGYVSETSEDPAPPAVAAIKPLVRAALLALLQEDPQLQSALATHTAQVLRQLRARGVR